MSTVTIEVADPKTADARFLNTMNTGQAAGAYITFSSVEQLWATLTVKRWQIVQALCGAGPVTLRDTARRVGRDVKGVHTDVHALLCAGVLEKTPDGRLLFPYETVHVDFRMRAAA